MLPRQKIELHKVRRFGEKMNATVEFIRQNLKTVFKVFSIIFLPVAAIQGILLSQFFEFFFSSMTDPQMMASFSSQFFMSFGLGYFGFLIITIVASVLMAAVCYSILHYYQEHFPQEITPKQALEKGFGLFGKFFGFTLVMILAVSVLPVLLFVFGALGQMSALLSLAVVLMIFPGIYVFTALSLGFPVMVFERAGISEAISRSFNLIKEKFWSTFGLLFVTYIAQSFVASVFAIPFYFFYFIIIFTMTQSGVVEFSDPSVGFKIGFAVSFIILIFGQYISTIIPLTALTYQYGNLVEIKESPGLIKEIEQLGEEKEEE